MSEKKNIISSNTKRRKKRWPPTGGGGGGDELATVKAAAWAWYQRNEGKPMIREFDLTTRATRTHQPSRYKLEARGDQETKLSSLLDPYEIKSISRRIDEGSLPTNPTSIFRHDHYNHVISQKKKLEYDDSKKENGLLKKMCNTNLWKGIILMAPRTVCGRSDDVHLGAYQVGPTALKVAPTSLNTRTRRH